MYLYKNGLLPRRLSYTQALLASLGSLASSFFKFYMYILCMWQNNDKTIKQYRSQPTCGSSGL